jgi:glycosyltransferase involved in cell wall biosynthesis
MKIGIDARMYGPAQGGIGRYIEQLIEQLQTIDQNNQYVIFLRTKNFTECKIVNPNFKKVLADIPWYGLNEHTKFNKIIKKEGPNLMHFPHWNVPLFYRGKFIVTIHDLIMHRFPRTAASTHGPLVYFIKDKLYRLILSSAAKRSLAIITTSDFTKNDLVKELKINPKKINITYQAPFTKKLSDEPLPVEVKKPYALYVGACYSHKNLPNLITAWKKIEKLNPELNLILTGRRNFFYDQLIDSAEFRNCTRIKYLPNPTDELLETLYKNAALLVFPSLYEGFGLPPLEAMLRNIPVVSSNTSCLPEILGNAAWYFDPNDIEDMVRKILTTFNNQDLRDTLQKSGQELVKKYSWEKLARETLCLYQKSG